MSVIPHLKLLSAFVRPRRFGYFTGHWQMTDAALGEVQRMLERGEGPAVVAAYEQACARLAGTSHAISYAAGRMAFHAILQALGVGSGDEVLLTGFTCSVMANAVWRSGARAIYADISPATFGTDPVDVARKITAKTKVVVAQHSFGIPCAIDEIAALCRERGVFLVEDCALAVGSTRRGKVVGSWGDAAIFSTDHSKPLNTMVGGFLATSNDDLAGKARAAQAGSPTLSAAHQRRLFARLRFERRHFVPSRYGRGMLYGKLQGGWRKLRAKFGGGEHPVFLEADFKPRVKADTYPYPARLPAFLAQVGLDEIARWSAEAAHRKTVLREYLTHAAQSGLAAHLPAAYHDPAFDITPLRLVYAHPRAEEITRRMARDFDLSWVWFREPIVCAPAGLGSFNYQLGACPVAERIGAQVLNWPCAVPPAELPRLLELFAACHRDL